MNSSKRATAKQKRAKIKQKLEMADVFVELVEQILEDIDSGKSTKDVRQEMDEIKHQLVCLKAEHR